MNEELSAVRKIAIDAASEADFRSRVSYDMRPGLPFPQMQDIFFMGGVTGELLD